jgi:hypothetical protein
MSFIIEQNEDFITLNLWGGHHVYHIKGKKYSVVRDCGIFSNLTVILYGVFTLITEGYEVENLEIVMTDYFKDKDVYPILFQKKNISIDFSDISINDINFFRANCIPSICGLGLKNWTQTESTIHNFNLKITSRIINKFFTPNPKVYELLNDIIVKKNIRGDDYVFIWARRTDKVEETKVPNAKNYYDVLVSNDLLNEKIFVQTDDRTMFDEFNQLKMNFECLDEIPFATSYSFHRNISQTPDESFYEMYKITKEEYVMRMMCVVLLAANSKKPIIYPGNPTTVVPMYRNSFNGCILFKDDIQIF